MMDFTRNVGVLLLERFLAAPAPALTYASYWLLILINTNVLSSSSNIRQKENVLLLKDLYVPGYLLPHPELCPGKGIGIKVLILVMSAPTRKHSVARFGIRQTWKNYAREHHTDVTIAFFIGRSSINKMRDLVKENKAHRDIIVGKPWDSSSNQTLKALSMLEWTSKYCPRARWILKCDDDTFVNVPQLLYFLQHPGRDRAIKSIWGRVLRHRRPCRKLDSKYYLSPAQFPQERLPDFVTGPAYLMTSDTVPELLAAAAAQAHVYLRLEDVFVTGVLAARAAVSLHFAREFYNEKVEMEPCAVQGRISIHEVKYNEQFQFLDSQIRCS